MYPYTVATVSVIGLVYRTVPATLAAAAATSAIRDHVAAEAAWLRDLVRGDLGRGEGVLSTALDRAVQLHTRAGLRIELNAAGLGAGAVPPEAVEAIAGAVSELLTNVRKHAEPTSSSSSPRIRTARDDAPVSRRRGRCGMPVPEPADGMPVPEPADGMPVPSSSSASLLSTTIPSPGAAWSTSST